MEIKRELERILAGIYESVAARERWGVATIEVRLENPPSLEQGDFATALPLRLAPTLKRAPLEIASRLLSEAQQDEALLAIATPSMASPGFLNLRLRDEALKDALNSEAKLPAGSLASAPTIVIDYSSPNVAKPMGVGHLRSTIIGDSLKRIYCALGWKVVGVNHLGDWGTQMGKLLVAFKRQRGMSNNKFLMSNVDIAELLKLYVQFHKEAEKHPELEEQAKLEAKKLQDGDKENRLLWKRFTAASYKEFREIYKRLGVRIESWKGESAYQPKLAAIVKNALDLSIAQHSEGAVVISFGETMAPWVLQKQDGAYLYTTTDLAALRYRLKTYHPEKILYVVGNEQTLHFEQFRHAAEMLGYSPKEKIVHVKFGLVSFEGKKLSTRAGRSIDLSQVLDEAVKRASDILKDREMTKRQRARVAEIVGIGALKYHDLVQGRTHDIAFDWDRALSLTGNSAPYLQYVVVRINSILRKSKILSTKSKSNPKSKTTVTGYRLQVTGWRLAPTERELLRRMLKFQEVVEAAAASYEPHRIAEYLYQLAGSFNRFYETTPVLDAAELERSNRLLLIARVANTLQTGLHLLGIEVPERM